MDVKDIVIHVKFAISTYLDCRIENIYTYSLKQSKHKVNPLVGATNITTDTEKINHLCESIYPKDADRRNLLYQEYLVRKAKLNSKELEEPCNVMPNLSSVDRVRPTLCEWIVQRKIKNLILDSGCGDLVCNSSGGQDLILNVKKCSLNLHLKNGTDHCHRFDLLECIES